MGAFLSGFFNAARADFEQKQKAEEDQREKIRADNWKIIADPNFSDESKQAAYQEIVKSHHPETKKNVSKFENIFKRLTTPAWAYQQEQGDQQQKGPKKPPGFTPQAPGGTSGFTGPVGSGPQAQPQPSPQGKLQPPPPIQQAQGQPQQQGSGPLQSPSPIQKQTQEMTPATPPATPQTQPMQTGATGQRQDLASGGGLLTYEERAGRARAEEKYKSDLQVAARNQELADKAKQEVEQQKAEDEAMENYAKTLTESEAKTLRTAHYNKRFTGAAEIKTPETAKKTDIHVKLKSGDWVPAEEWADGSKHSLDGKLIDPATIADVNKTGAAPEKFTGELKTYMDAYHIQATSKDPVELAAAGKTLKDLELKRQALISQAGSEGSLSEEQLKTLAKYDAITGNRTEISYRDPMMKAKYTAEFANAIRDFGGPEKTSEIAASYKANKANLEQLVKIQGAMSAAKAGTVAEIDRAVALSKKVPRSQAKLFNKAEQFWQANLTDYPELQRYREALLAARYRYNAMIASFKGAGAATNQIRSETAEEIVDRTMPQGAFLGAANEMKVGLGNVMKGLDDVVADTKRKIQTPATPSPRGTLLPPSGGSAEDPLGVLK